MTKYGAVCEEDGYPGYYLLKPLWDTPEGPLEFIESWGGHVLVKVITVEVPDED